MTASLSVDMGGVADAGDVMGLTVDDDGPRGVALAGVESIVQVLARVGLAVLPGEQARENDEADESDAVNDEVGPGRVRQIVDEGFAEIVQGVSHCRFLSVGLGLARFVLAVNDAVPGRPPVGVTVDHLSSVSNRRAMSLHPVQ